MRETNAPAVPAKDMKLSRPSIPARLEIPPLLPQRLLENRTRIRCVTAERRPTTPPRTFPRAGMRFGCEPCFPGSNGKSRSPRMQRGTSQNVTDTADVLEPMTPVQESNPIPSTVVEIDPPLCQRTGKVEFLRPATSPQKTVTSSNDFFSV